MNQFSSFARYGGIACTLAIPITSYMLPQWLALDYYRKFFQMYKGGENRPISPNVLLMVEEEAKKSLTRRQQNKTVFFVAFGFDPIHKGSLSFKTGAIVGLPVHFAYENEKQIDKSSIRVGTRDEVHWHTDAGEKLLKSLVLSPEGKRFAIARELEYIKWHAPLYNTLIAAAATIITFSLYGNLEATFPFFKKKMSSRLSLLSISAVIGSTLFCFMKDALSWHIDEKVDEKLIEKGLPYVEGGIEFYSKLLARNIALRDLLGKKGEKRFTACGNDNSIVRTVSKPYTARYDYIKKCLDNVTKTSKDLHDVTLNDKMKQTHDS